MRAIGFIIDDDGDAVETLSLALSKSFPEIDWLTAINSDDAQIMLQRKSPAVAILDLSLNKRGVDSGFEILSCIVTKNPSTRVIVLTGHADIEYGIRAIANGAAHFIAKPAELSHLITLVKDSLEQSKIRSELLRLNRITASDLLIGESIAIQKLREEVKYAASHNKPVLLVGETGTGKGVCARAIHLSSERKNQQFVRYQPNFASGDIVQSELFGHLKGSFTGALNNRRGLVAEADFGTLFLDEIDELPTEVQVALLNLLQERSYRPVGSDKELKSDFRLIAATNQNIELLLKTGKLRSDLYHRISFTTIKIPALRERVEDIKFLADFFLNTLRTKEEIAVFSIEEAAYVSMQLYSWPGNIRELQAVVENAAFRAAYLCRSTILREDLKIAINTPSELDTFNEKVESFKYSLVQDALSKVEGNQVRAAELLKLDRSTLRRIVSRTKEATNLRE